MKTLSLRVVEAENGHVVEEPGGVWCCGSDKELKKCVLRVVSAYLDVTEEELMEDGGVGGEPVPPEPPVPVGEDGEFEDL